MTIINPSRNKKEARFLVQLFLLLLAGGLLYVYFYIHAVDKRYSVDDTRDRIVHLEIENADLKNNLYSITDPANLEDMAFNNSLIFENNPKYLNLSRWVSDSSY